nr:glutamate receptor ionotropic, kainate 4-like [Cherax quadricarinatus]
MRGLVLVLALWGVAATTEIDWKPSRQQGGNLLPTRATARRSATTARLTAHTRQESLPEHRPVIRIAAETWQPYFLISCDGGGTPVYSGIMWDLLLIILDKMNLRFEIVRPPDGLWGVADANGSWNGMLGMIQRQEVDMALGPFAVSYQRTKVADFPATIFVLPHRLYLARPTGSYSLGDFVRLYQPKVWVIVSLITQVWVIVSLITQVWVIVSLITQVWVIVSLITQVWVIVSLITQVWVMVLVSIVVTTAAVWLTTGVKGSFNPVKNTSFRRTTTSFTYIFLHVWGALLQASALEGARCMAVDGIGCGGRVLAAPTAVLVATDMQCGTFLLTRGQLWNRQCSWRWEQGGIILQTFKTAEVKLYKKLLAGSEGVFPDCFASRYDIAQGKFAGLCDVLAGEMMVAESYSESGRCEFFSPRENIVTHSYTMIMKKGSTLTNHLNFWLSQLQERGWVEQLVRRSVNNGSICNLPPGQEDGHHPPTPLTIYQMWGVFAILVAGVGVAGLTFLVELIITLTSK